jgi:Mg2+ and Co2+ transporter CorA
MPNTPRFRKLCRTVDFCPVFFDQEIRTGDMPSITTNSGSVIPRTTQPLAVLPSRYGETLDWDQVRSDPLTILQELFQFQSSAASQYLNMLRDLTTEISARTPPTGETLPSMDDILHFEYTKSVLERWHSHFETLAKSLDHDMLKSQTQAQAQASRRAKVYKSLGEDLNYLADEAEDLIKMCDSGKSTIMSSFTVYESRQATKDANLVTQLTKATNRITFIFLPISFVTSVFGMNFKQFGQGPLSITLWLAVALPLLGICIFLTERSSWMTFCRRILVPAKQATRTE